MSSVDTLVIGAGHAGLAVSRLLTLAGEDHVVLDRGRVGERWRTERWDSLHLLTPSWMLRLPHWSYTGDSPESYLSRTEFIEHLEAYAASFSAPVIGGTTVQELALSAHPELRYRAVTDRGTWLARNVVIATGPHGVPQVPAGLGGLETVHAAHYRNPDGLPSGGVLVVGASASGVQIADELARTGRDVTLSVGRHTRVPRRYRGRDIFFWLERTGRLSRTIDEVADPIAARREPSLQLTGNAHGAGTPDPLDLGVLQQRGVRLVGRLDRVEGQQVSFRDDLHATVGAADLAMHRVLDAADRVVGQSGRTERPAPVAVPRTALRLDLRAEGIGAVVLATGYRPDHSWVRLPVLAPDGSIQQHRGATELPGVYVVGQRFQHRRDSGFIDGARHDAHAVVAHLLATTRRNVPSTEEESAA